MKQYPMIQSRGAKIAFGLYLAAMLFLSRDTLISSCLLGFTKSQILMFGLILLLGIAFLWENRRHLPEILKDRRVLLMAVSGVVLLLPMLAKRDWQLMYFSVLLCVLFSVFVTYFTTSREVAKYYVVLLTALGLYSIFATYFLRELAWRDQISVPVFYNSNDWEFFHFGLTYAVTWENWNRNFGIFREPGVYQFFVLLAVYLNNYFVNWNKPWKLWLCNTALAFTMLTTFAIGGFAELGLFILFLYFDKRWYREKWGKIAGVSFLLAMTAVVGYILYRVLWTSFETTIFYEFYDMFIRLFTKSDSSMDRVNAITTNLQLFAQKPVFGDTVANVLHGTAHNTSSTLLLYAMGGIACGSLNVAAWVALAWERKRSIGGNLLLLLILFLSFNTQNLIANVYFWLFPMMALVERGLPVLKFCGKKE